MCQLHAPSSPHPIGMLFCKASSQRRSPCVAAMPIPEDYIPEFALVGPRLANDGVDEDPDQDMSFESWADEEAVHIGDLVNWAVCTDYSKMVLCVK
jgi:hypothetical protein